MSILVAGGAGYIGAHVVRLLLERGEEVVVVDDLSYGTPERVKGAALVELDGDVVGRDRLHDARARGARVLCGGQVDAADCYVAPTLLDGVPLADLDIGGAAPTKLALASPDTVVIAASGIAARTRSMIPRYRSLRYERRIARTAWDCLAGTA